MVTTEKLRILILEDVPEDAELMERELRKAHFDFISRRVATENDVLRQVREWSPDVVLADYSLPGFDGKMALALARAFLPERPFLFVSGTIGEEKAIEALKSGATDYVLKHRLSRLLPCVERAIIEAQERAERKQSEENLTRKVQELMEANRRLEEFNQLMVGREQKVIALKQEANDLARQLGRPAPYDMKAESADEEPAPSSGKP